MEEGEVGLNCFVLQSNPIWGQSLNNFVADCGYHSQSQSDTTCFNLD